MSGYYPPGVTGNEWQIAGPSWEGEVERTCGASGVTITLVRADDGEQLRLDMDECPFVDGEVYAVAYDGVLQWICPACGREHEEDRRDSD